MSIRILMVDDQPVILAALARMLGSDKEFEIRAVSDPTKALEQALEFDPAVILQDLVMDGLDGLTLLKRYRAHPQLTEVPVVMLSAAEEPETKVEAFRCGANDYVVKLPTALELAARIRYHGRAFHNARQRELAFQALLESRAALEQRQLEIERQQAQLEAQARQLEAVNRELADTALSDTLTGLRNRRYLRLFLDLPGAVAMPPDTLTDRRTRIAPERLIFFLFDLDHFKQINDHYGHDAGDAVLVEIAQRMRRTLRTSDAAMRWGGEEFLIIARGIDIAGASVLAQRLLNAIATEPIRLASGQSLHITASLGFAPWPWSDSIAGGNPDHQLVIGLADAGTYLAKLEGRNRAYGVLPGPDADFADRLSNINLGPGILRPEDGKGVRLVTLLGPKV
jgi:two-component system chemotaxis family response regulator WspR